MDEKELEKMLQEKADEIEVRDFSLVWEDIKEQIEPPRKKTNHRWRWISAVASVVGIAVACSIIIPVALNQNSNSSNQSSQSSTQGYFHDDLESVGATFEEFSNALTLANIQTVDFQKYVTVSCKLVKTSKGLVVGGQIELTDNLENSSFFMTLRLYTEDVTTKDDLEIVYDQTYAVNNATIEYRLKESYPSDSIYVYDVKANYKSVNYYMEYTGFAEDIKPFLDNFFA